MTRRNRHGLSPVKTRVMVRGLRAVNLNSAAARAFVEHRAELVEALGGQDRVSPQQRGLVEMAARLRLIIDHGYAWLYEHGAQAINARRRAFAPLVRELKELGDSYTRILDRLGLERAPAREKTLDEVVREIEQAKAARAAGPTKTTLGPRGEQAPAKPADPGIGAKVSTVAKRGGDARVIPGAEQAPAVVTPRSLVPDPAYPAAPLEVVLEQAAEVPEF